MASSLEVMNISGGKVMVRYPVRLPPTLTTLSSEIILNILQWVPQTAFNSLVQTCVFFREFIKLWGISICNSQLFTFYPEYFELLNIQKHVNGWLVATSHWFFTAELEVRQNLHVSYGSSIPVPVYIDYTQHGRVVQRPPGISSMPQFTSLLSPGPQLLAFLNRYDLVLRASFKQMVTIDGKSVLLWVDWLTHYALQPFLRSRSKFRVASWYLAPMFVTSYDLIAASKAKIETEIAAKGDGGSLVDEVKKNTEASDVRPRRSARLMMKKSSSSD
ncbi:hypothetical protein VTL71DRAFT_10157 [Oculimacula yallundae]|uniref:F-box domain-containing protein n=1 Tax=Oculimacula yallundae TaxID=86028 RepID=A0ABR4BPR8_9HELO